MTGTGTPTTAPVNPPTSAPQPARLEPAVALGEAEADPGLDDLAQRGQADGRSDEDRR